MNDRPLLQADAIDKSFVMGAVVIPVLKGVSLSLGRGERTAIMGASGAGKTTLLHVLGGLESPTAGRVMFDGTDVYSQSPARRTALRASQTGFIFQAYYLLPELTVLENVMLPAMALPRRLQPKSRATRDRAESLLSSVGLSGRLHHLPTELSGGEQQRTAVARAMMNNPEILFCDEPTGNLDSKTGDTVLQCLFRLVEDHQVTLLLVSHNRALCDQCDRVLFLRDGRLETAQE